MRMDLSKLWEEHTNHEFTTRDTESTLATMTEDAYVNHIPVMTGGSQRGMIHGTHPGVVVESQFNWL